MDLTVLGEMNYKGSRHPQKIIFVILMFVLILVLFKLYYSHRVPVNKKKKKTCGVATSDLSIISTLS